MPHPRTKSAPRTIDTDALLAAQRKMLENIPAWLRYRGMKQTTLADRLGTSDGQISKYLNGVINMKAGLLREIAHVLNTHPGDLLSPPPEEGMGARVEETLKVMEQVTPEAWDSMLAMARNMAPRAK